VVNTTDLSHGSIDVKWQGRVISARIQDVRRHLVFLTYFLDLHDDPIVRLRNHVSTLQGTSRLFSYVLTPQGWQLSRAAKEHPDIWHASIICGKKYLGLNC
jgi:hypothetical protein